MSHDAGFLRARRRVMTAWALAMTLDVWGYSILLVDHVSSPGDAYDYWLEPLLAGVFYYVVGILIHRRYPRHRVAHAFLAAALAGSVQTLAGAYAHLSLYARPELPLGAEAALVSGLSQLGFVVALVAILYLYPDGRLASPRWRIAVAGLAVGLFIEVLTSTFRPGVMDIGGVANPAAWSAGYELLELLSPIRTVLLVAGVGAALFSPIARYRRASGLERLQIRWLAFGATMFTVALLAVGDHDVLGSVMWGLAPGFLPVAAGIAILRYRLYDLGLVVRRTVTYTVLVAVLVTIYAGAVLGLGALGRAAVRDSSDLVVAASTLIAAALFQPLRSRIQRAVDQRFDRARAGTEATVEGFGRALRDQIDVTELRSDLERAVAMVARPRTVALWLAPSVTATTTPSRNGSGTVTAYTSDWRGDDS